MSKLIQKLSNLLLILGIMVITFNLDVIKADPIISYQLEFNGATSISDNVISYLDGATLAGTVNLYVAGEPITPIDINDNGGHYETDDIANESSYVLNTNASIGYSLCSISIDGHPVSSEDINEDGEYNFNSYNANNSRIMVDISFATDCTPEGGDDPSGNGEYKLEFSGASSVNNNVVSY